MINTGHYRTTGFLAAKSLVSRARASPRRTHNRPRVLVYTLTRIRADIYYRDRGPFVSRGRTIHQRRRVKRRARENGISPLAVRRLG